MKRSTTSWKRAWTQVCVATAMASVAACDGNDSLDAARMNRPGRETGGQAADAASGNDQAADAASGNNQTADAASGDALTDAAAPADSGRPDGGTSSAPNKRPNVVFLLADDLGYGDLASYKHPYAKTPNLDKLARGGTRFNRFYSTGTVCNPSRTGWMTSVHPSNFAQNTADYGFRGQPTITSLLKRAGYKTGHCGKWHIGPTVDDGTYGIDQIDTSPPGSRTSKARDAGVYECAMDFLSAHHSSAPDQPFYLNVWGHSTHFPVNPDPSLTANFAKLQIDEGKFGPWMKEKFADARELGTEPNVGMRNYLSDVYGLDQSVGRLLAKLDELGLSENTIVVFSSDNGPAPVDARKTREALEGNMLGWAGGLRGGKHTFYEGGVRVPFIVRWPGHVPANRVDTTSVISALDWLPTLASIVGVPVPRSAEGQDISAVWQGKPRVRADALFWRWGKGVVLFKNWKYLESSSGAAELYDLSKDPGERRNLAGTNLAMQRQLSSMASNWLEGLPPPVRSSDD